MPRPRKNVKNNKKRVVKRKYQKKSSGITMNQMLNKMCITKIHTFGNLDVLRPWGTSIGGSDTANWFIHLPANLNRNTATSATIDAVDRESSRIHFKNCKYDFTIHPDRKYFSGLQYRIVLGYFKGDDTQGAQSLTEAKMTSMYPRINTLLKNRKPGTYSNPSSDDIYFKYISKVSTITPKMVYDANGSDDNTTGSNVVDGVLQAGHEPMRGIWQHRSHKLNFQINRTLSYEDGDGDSLNGWCPFLAIQCIGMDYPLTKPNIISDPDPANRGAFPGPLLTLQATSYFCDLH